MKANVLGVAVMAGLCCVLSASSVAAQTTDAFVISAADPTVSRIKVYLRDVDMRSPDAMAVIYDRISTAADHVCDSQAGLDLTIARIDRACAKASLARAISDLGMSSLNTYALSVNPDTVAVATNRAAASPTMAAK
jgi:UrcA family protein